MSDSEQCSNRLELDLISLLVNFSCDFDLILLNVLRPLFCAHSWLNWVDEDDDEVGLKEKPEYTRYIKKITSK